MFDKNKDKNKKPKQQKSIAMPDQSQNAANKSAKSASPKPKK